MEPETPDMVKMGNVSNGGLEGKILGDRLFVSSKNKGVVRVQVFDLLGKCLYKSAENIGATSTLSVDLKSLPRGRYVIKVEQNSRATHLQWNKK
jgi:hypothetical protein